MDILASLYPVKIRIAARAAFGIRFNTPGTKATQINISVP